MMRCGNDGSSSAGLRSGLWSVLGSRRLTSRVSRTGRSIRAGRRCGGSLWRCRKRPNLSGAWGTAVAVTRRLAAANARPLRRPRCRSRAECSFALPESPTPTRWSGTSTSCVIHPASRSPAQRLFPGHLRPRSPEVGLPQRSRLVPQGCCAVARWAAMVRCLVWWSAGGWGDGWRFR